MEQLANRTDKYGALDIAKLFFSILVCASHCRFMLDSFVMKYIDPMSVPFFFVASGFFLSFKMTGYYGSAENLLKIRQSIMQMIRRYMVWTVIALPIIMSNIIERNESAIAALVWFARDAVFRGEFEWGYMCTWYILSSIYALLIVHIVLKHSRSEISLVLIIITFSLIRYYLLQIPNDGKTLTQSINDGTVVKYLFDNTIRWYNARVMQGIYVFPAGMLIAKYGFPHKLRFVPWIMVAPVIYVSRFFSGTISSTIIGALSFLCLYTIRINSGYICRACRRISTIVFFTHMFFIYIYQKINGLRFEDVFNTTVYSNCVFAFSLCCSGLLGVFIHIMNEKGLCRKVTRLLL